MCGIAGVFDRRAATSADALRFRANAMAAELTHRGPDDAGVWVDESCGVALGFRRLAIIDLSAAGHQPMHSADGRYTIVFNGELYNYLDLRRELITKSCTFRGGSDTEVVLAAVSRWGLDPALDRFNGMFAFALWDADERHLTLCRDRLGEKPLYYGWAGDELIFSSELKGLRAHPGFRASVDRQALASYLRYTYVPSPRSIYEDAWKLPPGCTLRVAPGTGRTLPAPRRFWDLRRVSAAGQADRLMSGEDAAVDQLDELLGDAVALRLHSDVPIGAFLSGGVDSATVVALAQAQSSRPVRTFTVAMADTGIDESPRARAVARHLGTDHTEVCIQPTDAMALIPSLPERWDEPFSDPSQLPTALICSVAREHVTVCLSGDGGDEVFGGYNRYVLGRRMWERLGPLPAGVRRRLSRLLLRPSPSTWERWGRLLPPKRRLPDVGGKAQKLAALLQADDPAGVYLALVSQWDATTVMLGDGAEDSAAAIAAQGAPPLDDFTEQMMFLDSAMSLPDDMLTKVDRASMSVSLEARVPLLDHRVVELAWRLPPQFKVGPRQGKRLLRKVLSRYVPPSLVDGPKMGFDPPIGVWLRGPLRDWAESLLSVRSLTRAGLLDPSPIRAVWAEHLSERRNRDYELWTILMFQAWSERG
jgi:asparagine synthase (glutamine-hydrolysing)